MGTLDMNSQNWLLSTLTFLFLSLWELLLAPSDGQTKCTYLLRVDLLCGQCDNNLSNKKKTHIFYGTEVKRP